jgi:DNA-binding MarR family transcriptional regulator
MDLTPVQSRVVGYLAHRSEPPCAKDVEEEFQLSHPTVSGILSRLEKKGFVEFRPDPADRRCKRIYVLEKGWEHIGQIHRIINENEDRIVDGFTEEEKQQFAAFLERAIRNMGGSLCHHKEEKTE